MDVRGYLLIWPFILGQRLNFGIKILHIVGHDNHVIQIPETHLPKYLNPIPIISSPMILCLPVLSMFYSSSLINLIQQQRERDTPKKKQQRERNKISFSKGYVKEHLTIPQIDLLLAKE